MTNLSIGSVPSTAAAQVEEADVVRVSLHSGEVIHSPDCDAALDNYNDDVEGDKTHTLAASRSSTYEHFNRCVPDRTLLNRRYSFTHETLQEMSFESLTSDVWNISTDNEEIMLVDDKSES